MLTLEKARDVLRIDGTDNDEIIKPLLDTIPDYIELTTGLTKDEQDNEPLAETMEGFLLKLWYNAEQSDAQKLERVISNLAKTLTLKRNTKNTE